MMKLKSSCKKANKKKLRKLIKQLTQLHNEYEARAEDKIRALANAINEQAREMDKDIEDMENETSIRTAHTSELLRAAYSL